MLTPKQEKFVHEYLVCANATEAARRAGYSHKTARQIASENLSKPDIKAAIDREHAAVAVLAGIDRDWLVSELMANYEQARDAAKLRAALGALNSIAKILGLMPSGRGR